MHSLIRTGIGELGLFVQFVKGFGAFWNEGLVGLLWLASSVLATHRTHHDFDNVQVQTLFEFYYLCNGLASVGYSGSELLASALELDYLDVLDLVGVFPNGFNFQTGGIEPQLIECVNISDERFRNTTRFPKYIA